MYNGQHCRDGYIGGCIVVLYLQVLPKWKFQAPSYETYYIVLMKGLIVFCGTERNEVNPAIELVLGTVCTCKKPVWVVVNKL